MQIETKRKNPQETFTLRWRRKALMVYQKSENVAFRAKECDIMTKPSIKPHNRSIVQK